MFPELPAIGPLHIHTFGLMLGLALWLGLTWLTRESHRRGWDEDKITTLVLMLIVVSILGARALFVAGHWSFYSADPIAAVRVWEGGLTLYGGILVAIPAGILYCLHVGLPLWPVADAFAAPLALGMALGRMGCFLNGCCFGRPTEVAWAVHYPKVAEAFLKFGGAGLHPSPLYFTLAEGAILGLMLLLRGRLRGPGQLWWLFVMLDSVTRYLVDYTRYYEPSAFVAPQITLSQAISAGLFALGLVMFLALGRTTPGAPAGSGHETR